MAGSSKAPEHNQQVGRRGEQLAVDYLVKNGWRILAAPYRHKIGEIDIIAETKDVYAFIEVKTRRNAKFGSPAAAVTWNKQRKIIKTARCWLAQHNKFSAAIRFDVIAIMLNDNNEASGIEHIVAAFM